MPQLHLYVPEATAAKLHQRARARRLSTSAYLSEIVQRDIGQGWPKGYFDEVVGGWQGLPLERPPQPAPEQRDAL